MILFCSYFSKRKFFYLPTAINRRIKIFKNILIRTTMLGFHLSTEVNHGPRVEWPLDKDSLEWHWPASKTCFYYLREINEYRETWSITIRNHKDQSILPVYTVVFNWTLIKWSLDTFISHCLKGLKSVTFDVEFLSSDWHACFIKKKKKKIINYNYDHIFALANW